MQLNELEYFIELKREVAVTFRKTFPSSPAEIEEWKGQDIVNFQEELMQKVQGRISEKWFYTHIKSVNEKLPRIDMLNLLSEYAGYQGWNDFLLKKRKTLDTDTFPVAPASGTIITKEPLTGQSKVEATLKKKTGKGKLVMGIIALLLTVTVAVVAFYRPVTKHYSCCFVDMDGRTPVPNARIEVRILSLNESPVLKMVNKTGCFEWSTKEDKVRFVITSPYYLPDTVTRLLGSGQVEERIKLQTNDYALMIHYFSTSKVQDWKKRRLQLDDMIAENARVFHVFGEQNAMELYNKEEFINKLTIPVKSLRNIEIIETEYNSSGRIIRLKFRQREQ